MSAAARSSRSLVVVRHTTATVTAPARIATAAEVLTFALARSPIASPASHKASSQNEKRNRKSGTSQLTQSDAVDPHNGCWIPSAAATTARLRSLLTEPRGPRPLHGADVRGGTESQHTSPEAA